MATTGSVITVPKPPRAFIYATFGIVVLFAGLTAYLKPEVVQFWEFTSNDVVRLFTQLIVVSLVIERSLEVLLTPWREGEAEKLRQRVDVVKTLVQAGAEVAAPAAVQAIDEHEDYQDQTRRFAFLASLTIGLVVSMVGVRTLQFLAEPQRFEKLTGVQPSVFKIVDVVLTGAMLAGGADGLHKVVSVFTSYLDKTKEKNKSATP
jgi:hypothetical protein